MIIRPDSVKGQDVSVFSGSWNTSFQNDRDFLFASAWTYSGSPAVWRSFIQFDLDSLANLGCTVISAKLILQSTGSASQYHCGSGSTTVPCNTNQLDFSRIIEPWEEDTLLWNNQPQVTSSSSTTDLIVIPNEINPFASYEVEITDMVNFWLTQPNLNYGMRFALSSESFYSRVAFASSNNTNPNLRPMLVLELSCPNSCANLIEGYVYDDVNMDCNFDATENGLANWMVEIQPGPFYAITDTNGYYSAWVNSSSYTVTQFIPNTTLWNELCPIPYQYNLSTMNYGDTTSNVDFAVHADSYCPELTLDIGTGFFRKGHVSPMHVQYCNNGNQIATGVYVTIDFDPSLTPILSTVPWEMPQTGNVYEFFIDTLDVGQCADFVIDVQVGLNVFINQTLCVEGIITPIYNCTEPIDSNWDKSSVMVTGYCDNDSLACFTIFNTGSTSNGNMQGNSDYRIYENNVLVFSGTFQLNGQDSIMICWPANGNTIRLEADQRPGHPGNSHPNDVVEACGEDLQGNFVSGNVLTLPLDDDDLFVAIECHEVVFSWDPNDKTPIPKGIDQQGYISANDEIEYRIRFQNTGNDTALTIVVRDTLSEYLNPITFVNGVSSHNYTFNMYGNGILEWTFNNIMLPDSNVDESGSHGFIKFRIKQQPGNVPGTEIKNRAGIYFDYNDVVMTNTALNTINTMTAVSVPNIYDEQQYEVSVFPNPFVNAINFVVKGVEDSFHFTLYDITGKTIKQLNNNTNQLVMERDNLDAGIYYYTITSNNKVIANGKIVAQ